MDFSQRTERFTFWPQWFVIWTQTLVYKYLCSLKKVYLLHIQFALVFFKRKYLLAILPFRKFDDDIIMSSNMMANFIIITGNIAQPTFLKILRTLSSNSFCLTDSGIPATSKHYLLEYWAFAQHCLTKSMTLCWSKELTFFVTSSCYSRLVTLSFILGTSLSILVLDRTSVWSDSTIFMICFFNSFSSDSSK